MPLILFAFVVRLRDGLPLSASTDFEHFRELQERKQQLRTISKTLARFPERGTVKGQELNIFFISSEGVSYMTVCHCSLPVAKAFCFLEDLRWEFTTCFNSTAVSLADRPYPFLEFDSTIQKLKQQYNQSGGPALEVTLAEVQGDLIIHPPQEINLEEVDLTNGTANGHMEQGPASGQNVRLEPVTAPGILSLVLNIVCASLNIIRGVHLIEYTFQCHLYLFHSSLKKHKSFALLSVIVLCNLYLLGLRNPWQLLFHLSVACISTLLILRRKLIDRSNDCGV
ncbi:vesicle-trafficking protein SEC22c isoform X2 [Gymnodraco acuticeps]|uniref:Vesicle-trafficking protein SEC22c isoform X2 n=1 Tax=Gymnodraco acuticeps TaxID=8218 RepID=A0A6P8TFF3_GYMAC|nr:vesicle-trafficking protein SEC22c isoform X2 [Gymnodraco acuticeps]